MRQNLSQLIIKSLKTAAALLVCGLSALLPYKARRPYSLAVAAVIHLPFKLFCGLARYIMLKLGVGFSDFEKQ